MKLWTANITIERYGIDCEVIIELDFVARNQIFDPMYQNSDGYYALQVRSSLYEKLFLRTARSFYESLWYLLTYVLTYVQVIFRRSHLTLKLIKQKTSEIIQVNVPNFFYFAEIQKMTKLGPKNRFWDLKIKINPSGSHPTLNPLFFNIQTWNFTWWSIATF